MTTSGMQRRPFEGRHLVHYSIDFYCIEEFLHAVFRVFILVTSNSYKCTAFTVAKENVFQTYKQHGRYYIITRNVPQIIPED